MKLYLAQHGPATSKEENPERPLTDAGAATVRRMADFLKRADGLAGAADARHSGKLRARQTAEILVEGLRLHEPAREAPGLGPLDEVAPVAEGLASEARDVLIVGHLPHVSRLASLLVFGDADREAFAFRQGGVLCLEGDDEADGPARWNVRWMVVPELLPG